MQGRFFRDKLGKSTVITVIEDEKRKMKSNIHLLGKKFVKLELISNGRDNRFIEWLFSNGLTLT